MKCPKCNSELLFAESTDEYWDAESYSVRWRVGCCKCDFEGYLWQSYGLQSEEWDNEEDDNQESVSR